MFVASSRGIEIARDFSREGQRYVTLTPPGPSQSYEALFEWFAFLPIVVVKFYSMAHAKCLGLI